MLIFRQFKLLRQFRRNPNFIYKKNFHRLMIYSKEFATPEIESVLNNPDEYLNHKEVNFFKKSRGRTIGMLQIGKHALVIKRYNIRGFWHGLKIKLRPSRAFRSWLNTHYLHTIGIKTITPIAIIEKRYGPFRDKAYFISEYTPGVPGCEYFADSSSLRPQWSNGIQAIEELILQMKQYRLYHTDFHFGNLLMVNDKPLLLDLDQLKKFRKKSFRFHYFCHKKDLLMLKISLNKYLQAKVLFQTNRIKNLLQLEDEIIL